MAKDCSIDLDAIRVDLVETLKEVGERNGVVFELGSFSYNSNSFRGTLTATDNPTGDVIDVKRNQFEANAWRVNIDRKAFGKTFSHKQSTYKVIGIAPKSRKYPIICENLDNGKQFKFNVDYLKTLLK